MSPVESRWHAGAPWYAPYRGLLAACAGLEPAHSMELLNAYARAASIRTLAGQPLQFVAAPDGEPAADGLQYEQRIASTGVVQTRIGAQWRHDFFNACVWLTFPRIKAALNALQAEQFAQSDRIGGRRTPLGDAATLFDENAALLIGAAPALEAALRRRDWHDLFVAQRSSWAQLRVFVIGHGLLQKFAAPYKRLTAQTWMLPDEDVPHRRVAAAVAVRQAARCDAGGATLHGVDGVDAVDAVVAARLGAWLRDGARRQPLPLAGIPGWCIANGDPAFYNDPHVFRAPGGGAAASIPFPRQEML